MPIALIVLGVVGVWFLIKKQAGNVNVAVVPTTPGNGGLGITTGFAPPSIETGSTGLVGSDHLNNQPSSSASGVPDYSSQAQEFNTGEGTILPSSGFGAFYHPAQRDLFKPIASMMETKPTESGCGCKGRSDGCAKGPSDCGNQKRRMNDSGCLAPSQARQIKNTPLEVFHNWASNIRGAGYNMFDATDHALYTGQLDNAPNPYDNFIPPAAPGVTTIGMPAEGF